MLKSSPPRRPAGARGRFAIVASEFNRRYVNSMLRAAQREFAAAGVQELEVLRVPGAFEIPVVAARLAARVEGRPEAILCLGVVFQGETSHARHISEAVSRALADIQVRHLLPVIHGVYQFDNEQQARVRCLSPEHNRGTETARTALAMARLLSRLR